MGLNDGRMHSIVTTTYYYFYGSSGVDYCNNSEEGDVPPVERVTDRGIGRTSGVVPALWVVTAFGAMTFLVGVD